MLRLILLAAGIALTLAYVWRLAQSASTLRREHNARGAPISPSQARIMTDLRAVTDPRVAATAMMVATAEHDGTVTKEESDIIVDQAKAYFELDDKAARELLLHAHGLVRNIKDIDLCYDALLPTIKNTCGPRERDELLTMVSAVARQNADESAIPLADAIARLHRELV